MVGGRLFCLALLVKLQQQGSVALGFARQCGAFAEVAADCFLASIVAGECQFDLSQWRFGRMLCEQFAQ